MPIPVTCTNCGANFGVKEKCAGMHGRCPKCNGTVQVPAAAPEAEVLDTSWLDDVETDAPAERPAPKQQPQPPSPSQPQPAAPRPRAVPTPAPAAATTNGSIEFQCGKCGAGFKVAASLAGRTAKCQKCGEALRVPTQSIPKPTSAASGAVPAPAPTHFANPLKTPARTPAKTAAAASPDDLLAELGVDFGLGALDAAASSPFAPLGPLGAHKVKRKRNGSAAGMYLGWADYTFLGLWALGLVVALATGMWVFFPLIPAGFAFLIVALSCFITGQIGLGLLSFVCGLPAYVIGWMKAREWDLSRVMVGWTIAYVLTFVLFFVDAFLLARRAALQARANATESQIGHEPMAEPPDAEDPVARHNASASGAPAARIPTNWRMHVSPEAQYRIAMPEGRPVRRSEMMSGPLLLRLTGEGIETDEGRALYLVAYTSPAMPFDESKSDEHLLLGRDGLSRTPGFRIVSERFTTIAGARCLELDISVKQGIMTYWFFIARGRIYQLMVARPENEKGQRQEQEFVDSFAFLTPEVAPQPSQAINQPSIVRGGSGSGRGGPSHSETAASDNLPDGTPPRAARPHRMAESKDDFEEAMDYLASNTPVFGLNALADMRPNDQRARVIAAVMPFLTSTDDSLQSDAVKVLGVWGTEQELPAMLDLLDDSDTFVRHDAIDAVARFKTATVAEAIADRLPHDAMQAEEALREMGEVAESAVARYLKHPDQFTRSNACEILGDIGTPKCAPELFKLEHDPSLLVTSAADEALRKIRFRHNVDAEKSDVPNDGDNPFDDE